MLCRSIPGGSWGRKCPRGTAQSGNPTGFSAGLCTRPLSSRSPSTSTKWSIRGNSYLMDEEKLCCVSGLCKLIPFSLALMFSAKFCDCQMPGLYTIITMTITCLAAWEIWLDHRPYSGSIKWMAGRMAQRSQTGVIPYIATTYQKNLRPPFQNCLTTDAGSQDIVQFQCICSVILCCFDQYYIHMMFLYWFKPLMLQQYWRCKKFIQFFSIKNVH